MTAQRVAGVLLSGRALRVVVWALRSAQEMRRRDGLPPSRELADLLDVLAEPAPVSAPMSACPRPDILEGPTGHPEPMTVDDAAPLLGVSTRQARRLAPTLGGQKLGGTWVLDAAAVAEHIEGANQ